MMSWRKICLVTVVLTADHVADALNGLANFKVPTLQAALQSREAQEKFGDKKIVVITGPSSGLGRATARHLLRTGK